MRDVNRYTHTRGRYQAVRRNPIRLMLSFGFFFFSSTFFYNNNNNKQHFPLFTLRREHNFFRPFSLRLIIHGELVSGTRTVIFPPMSEPVARNHVCRAPGRAANTRNTTLATPPPTPPPNTRRNPLNVPLLVPSLSVFRTRAPRINSPDRINP